MADVKALPWPIKTVSQLFKGNMKFRTFEIQDGAVWMIFDPTSHRTNVPKVLIEITTKGVTIYTDACQGKGREFLADFPYTYHKDYETNEMKLDTGSLQQKVWFKRNEMLETYGIMKDDFDKIQISSDGTQSMGDALRQVMNIQQRQKQKNKEVQAAEAQWNNGLVDPSTTEQKRNVSSAVRTAEAEWAKHFKQNVAGA